MQGIYKIKPEQIDVKDAKKSESGKWYYSYGIKSNGDWHNGVLFNKAHAEALKQHEGEIELFFYEEEYKGEMKNKCRFVTQKDRDWVAVINRIEALEKAVFKMNPETPITDEIEQSKQIDSTDDDGNTDDLQAPMDNSPLPF